MNRPISLIIKRFAAILALVVILAAFGGTWAGKGQTIPIERAENYHVWLPVIER